MKMYILVKDSVPLGKAMVAVAHASLACYLEFQSFADMKEWVKGTFYKVVCKVNDKEFERAKEFNNFLVITEGTLDDEEVAIVFSPRPDAIWPKPFKYYALYK
jgi:peptidyl-tRNA hydrolase